MFLLLIQTSRKKNKVIILVIQLPFSESFNCMIAFAFVNKKPLTLEKTFENRHSDDTVLNVHIYIYICIYMYKPLDDIFT